MHHIDITSSHRVMNTGEQFGKLFKFRQVIAIEKWIAGTDVGDCSLFEGYL